MRILLVDDHAMFRGGLRAMLQTQFPGVEISEAGDSAEALAAAKSFKPELAVMDLHLPDENGISVSRKLLADQPELRIIILSGESNLTYVDSALQQGVCGYLLKVSAPDELPRAIQSVLHGQLYLCAEANAAVLQQYKQRLAAAPGPQKPLLSGRELEVLRLVAEGLRSKEIAARLNVGVKSVETYRRRLMQKVGCSSTADLVRFAIREGISAA